MADAIEDSEESVEHQCIEDKGSTTKPKKGLHPGWAAVFTGHGPSKRPAASSTLDFAEAPPKKQGHQSSACTGSMESSDVHYCLVCLADPQKPERYCQVSRLNSSKQSRHESHQHADKSQAKYAQFDSFLVQRQLASRKSACSAIDEAKEAELDCVVDLKDDTGEGVLASDSSPLTVATSNQLHVDVPEPTSGIPVSSSILSSAANAAARFLFGASTLSRDSTNAATWTADAQEQNSILPGAMQEDSIAKIIKLLSSQGEQLRQQSQQISGLTNMMKIMSAKEAASAAPPVPEQLTDTEKQHAEIQSASCMAELLKVSHLCVHSVDDGFIVYCVPCFTVYRKARLLQDNYSVEAAHRFLSQQFTKPSLALGLFITSERMERMHSDHSEFCKFWYMVSGHMSGATSKGHINAVDQHEESRKRLLCSQLVVRSLIRTAALVIESATAAQHYELFISHMASCGTQVGNISHGVEICNQLWKLLEVCMDRDASQFLREALPSTGLPPLICITCDKSTPSRTTNQAVLLLARDLTGEAVVIPAGAPPIYDDTMDAGGEALAKLALETMRKIDLPLNSIVGIVADGQYIMNGPFKHAMREQLQVQANDADFLPITWDAAHYLNLAVTDIRDGPSGAFFRRYVKRANEFSHQFGRGKGFSALEKATEEGARCISSFAMHRFASSAMKQWEAIAASYGALHVAFRAQNPNCKDDETLQYEMFRCDFVFDMLALLDLFAPLRELMMIAQDIQQPHWKVSMLTPKVIKFLEKRSRRFCLADYPPLEACYDSIIPGCLLDGVPLLDGWLVTDQTIHSRVNWTARDHADMEAEIALLAGALHDSLVSRVSKAASSIGVESVANAAVMDAATILLLLASDNLEVDVESYTESSMTKNLVRQAQQHTQLRLNDKLSCRYMASYVDCLHKAFKTGISRETWPSPAVSEPIETVSICANSSNHSHLSLEFEVITALGHQLRTRLLEPAVYQSLYSDPQLFQAAGQPACRLLDFALQCSGTEAVVETFYSTMRSQQQQGGQLNSTLELRTKLRCMLPSVSTPQMENLLKQAARLYHSGDPRHGLVAYQDLFFFDPRGHATNYNTSKVVDRLARSKPQCPFVGRYCVNED